MNADQYGRIAYLVLLLIAVGGWMLAANRRQIGKMAQQAAVWGFIFLGTVAGIGLWSDVVKDVAPRASVVGNRVEIPRGYDGHYHLTLNLNDVPVDFVIDTGASSIALGPRDAERVGIDLDNLAYIGEARTANGIVETAPVRLDTLTIGDIRDENVPAMVLRADLEQSLMGMSYLSRFARVSIEGNRLILER